MRKDLIKEELSKVGLFKGDTLRMLTYEIVLIVVRNLLIENSFPDGHTTDCHCESCLTIGAYNTCINEIKNRLLRDKVWSILL